MSEQTANLCTTDACESLRGRLAKYEDAEGNPISTIAEQAREIERLRLNIAEYNEHERCYQSEIERLKAQPNGVVLPPRQPANFHWNECLEEVKRLNQPGA